MADEDVVVNLTYDARASAQKTIADLDAISSRLTKVAQETGKVSDAAARISNSFSGLGRLTEKVANDLEPWGKAARQAVREFETLTSKIEALKAKMSRSEGEDKLLSESLRIVPLLKNRIDELTKSMMEVGRAQDKAFSPEYLGRLAAVQSRMEASIAALERFGVKLNSSIAGMSSFANAQQLISNSANRMTSEWASAGSLLNSLTREFNPAILATQGMTEKMQRLSQALKLGVVDGEQFAKIQQQIVNSFNTVSPAAEKMISVLKQYQNEQNRAQGERFKFQEQVAPSMSVSGHQQEIENNVKRQMMLDKDLFDSETRGFERVAATQRAATNQMIENLKRFQTAEAQADKERFKFAEQMAPSMNIARQRLNEFSKAQGDVTTNSRLMSYALTNMSFQINDVVSGLAMGQAPFRIFAQQAGQFFQIFQQIGRENIGQFFKDAATSVMGFVTAAGRWVVNHPLIVGLTALGAGFIAVVTHELEAETRLRSFGVILRTMGTDSLTSAKQLDEVVKNLRNTGSAVADAQAAVSAISRTPGVNPGRVGDIADTARNISAARGISLGDASSGLAGAIAGGADALTQYALSIGVKFTPAEQKAIDLTILHRDKVEQLKVAYGAISRTMDGEFGRSLSTTQKLINELATVWNKMLEAFGAETAVQTAIKGVTRLGEIITALTKGELKVDLTLNINGMSWADFEKKFSNLLSFAVPSPEVAERNKQLFNARRTPAGTVINIPSLDAGALGEPSSVPTVLSDITGGMTSTGAALTAAATANAQIGKLNDVFSKRLDAWLSALSDADRNLIQITSGFATSGHAPQSLHYQGLAVDIKNLSPSAAGSLGRFGLRQNVPGDWPHVEPSEIPSAGSASVLSRVAAGRSFAGGDLTASTSRGGIGIAEQVADITLRNTELNKYALALVQAQARVSALKEAEKLFVEESPENELRKQAFVTNAVAEATGRFNDTLNKGIVVENLRTKGVEDAGKAFEKGNVEGLKATAMAEAINRNKVEGISIEEAYREALARGAAEAVKGAAEQIASQAPVLTGLQKEAEAARISGRAQHDVRVENEANVITQRALDAEKAKGTDITKGLVIQLNNQAKAQILAKEAAQNSLVVTRAQNQAQDTIQVLQLQVQLLGQTSEEINRQVVLLQKKQELERDTTGLTKEQKENILAATDAIQRQVIATADANREWQRIESAIRGVADTIENTLTQSIRDAFDGKKVESWSETIKKSIREILAQIVNFTLIKPAIGTALGALGFGNLAQQFGGFGGSGSGGLLGGLFGGGGSGSGNITLQKQGDGSFKMVSDVGGAGKSIFDLFGGGGSGATELNGGFFSNLFGTGSSATSSGFLGLGNTLASDSIFSGFGAIQQGSSVGFAGGGELFGAAAGGLESLGAEGLLSGMGSLFSGLGSVVPFIGPLVGIASLLGGSLFKSKPSNFASGGNVNLMSGFTSAVSSSGNAQNDATSNQILKGISDAAKLITGLTGGRLAGDINVQAGTRDGIKLAGSIGNVGSPTGSLVGELKFGSGQEAIEAVTLALIHHVENLTSETMKTVLASITDPNQLQDAMGFVKVYDSLKDAFDNAFASIDTDTKKVGPFKQALDQINALFEELTNKAKEFGLSLEPVTAGLEEAKKRLKIDFDTFVQDLLDSLDSNSIKEKMGPFETALKTINDSFADLTDEATALSFSLDSVAAQLAETKVKLTENFDASVQNVIQSIVDPLGFAEEEAKRIGDALIKDAIAVGGDRLEVEKLNELRLAEVRKQFSVEEQKAAVVNFQSLLDIQKGLMTGPESGLTITKQLEAANDNFMKTFALLQGGDLTKVDQLAGEIQTAFKLSETAFGNAGQTAGLRRTILDTIDEALKLRSFASGTDDTPEGMIRVGENGPEWMMQKGGNVIFPNGKSPWGGGRDGNGNNGVMVEEVRALKAEIVSLREENTRVMVGVGMDTGKRIDGVKDSLDKSPIGVAQRRVV